MNILSDAIVGFILGFFQQRGIMESNLKIQNLHLLNVRVSEFPLIPMFSMFNFICSTTFPQFRTSIRTSLPINKLHYLSLSSSPSPSPVSLSENSSNEHSFEVSYFVNTFGWPPELAISKAKYLKFNTPEKPDNLLALLKKHGFTKTQILTIVKSWPQLIACNTQKIILPKIEFLSSIGLSTTEIPIVITAAPRILKSSLKKILIPSYNLLHNLVGSDDKAVEMIKRYQMVLPRDPEVDNIEILQEVGLPDANIVVYMTYKRWGYTPTADTFRMMVEKVKEMGFDPSHMKFLWAIWAMSTLSISTWERKVQALKKYGWSDRKILLAFEKYPKFILSSEDKIVGVIDFLVNRIGMDAAAIANRPQIINLSLEKRIVPRCLVYQVLLEKGLFKRKRKVGIFKVLYYTENQFLSRIIERFEDEAPELLNLYQGMLEMSK